MVHTSDHKVSALQLFSNWNLAKITLIMWFTWFSTSMCYYGLAQNTADLPGDTFRSFAMSGLSQFPGYIICIPMMEYWGRKPATIVLLVIGGVACILDGTLSNVADGTTLLVLALVGRCCISAVFAMIYNYAAELFPTVVRQTGTGLSSVFARFGALLAPQIRLLGDYIDPSAPMVIYGTFALAAGVLVVFLPETLGQDLPETIEDGRNFGIKSSSVSPAEGDVPTKNKETKEDFQKIQE